MSPKKPSKAKTKKNGTKKAAVKKTANNKVTSPTPEQAFKTATLVERKGISLWHPAAIICTVFSVGRIPLAPGTWGSLMGVVFFPLFLMAPLYVGIHTEQVVIVAMISISLLVMLYATGVAATKVYQAKTKTSDASEIVYDEFFGQILTYSIIAAFVIFLTQCQGYDFEVRSPSESIIYQYVPFLFFRLFDICKPWPINIVDRKENSAWGVMFDDVMAAFYAAAASFIVFILIAH